MKKATNIVLAVMAFICVSWVVVSCTENHRAKNLGGTAYVEIPEGKKLITATWKDNQIWYLYSDRQPGELPVKSVFKEQSKWGLLEGQIIFTEK